MKLVPISDTHSFHRKVNVPEGDVLICCGDITGRGEMAIIEDFVDWMKEQPHRNKLVVFGNHEKGMEKGYKREPALALLREAGIIYLEDSGVEIDGIHFWGSPWQPLFYSWEFNLPRGKALAEKWALIPNSTDVLITHGPPFNILDEAPRDFGSTEHCGCEELAKRVFELPNLKAHFFGHIHYSHGQQEINGIKFVNAAICTEDYKPTNPPIVVEI
jgi:predicted phosphodiesterase